MSFASRPGRTVSLRPTLTRQSLEFVVPWAFASLVVAEFEAERGERAEALERVRAALAGLARVEAEAHRDHWDAERVTAARELERRLAEQSR